MADKMCKTEAASSILIKVVGIDQGVVNFKIKIKAKMKKLREKYSQLVGLPEESLRFLFEGRRVYDHQSPEELEMEDGDTIEVYQEQTGGLLQ